MKKRNHLSLVPPVIVAGPASIVPRGGSDLATIDPCLRCGEHVDDEFGFSDGSMHWKCWQAERREQLETMPAIDVEHHIDTQYFDDDDEMGTGWYAIIRNAGSTAFGGADLWCGPHDTETRAIDAAKRKVRML